MPRAVACKAAREGVAPREDARSATTWEGVASRADPGWAAETGLGLAMAGGGERGERGEREVENET
jgi:hypothetical protein